MYGCAIIENFFFIDLSFQKIFNLSHEKFGNGKSVCYCFIPRYTTTRCVELEVCM